MNPYRLLGIQHDAAVADVKRAYAKKLKITRPDEDPVAFQRLQEAYAHCLDAAKYRELHGEDDDAWMYEAEEAESEAQLEVGNSVVSTSVPETPLTFEASHVDFQPVYSGLQPPEAQDAPPPTHIEFNPVYAELRPLDAEDEAAAPVDEAFPSFDRSAFIEAFTEHYVTDMPEDMAHWLAAHPDMVSIDNKSRTRWDVLSVMEETYPPVSNEMLDVVKQFFGLDQVDFSDHYLMSRLDALEGNIRDVQAFDGVKAQYDGSRAKFFDRLIYRELTQPFNVLRRAFILLVFGFPGRVREAWSRLYAANPEVAASVTQQDAVKFWLDATDVTRMKRPRLLLVALRVLILTPLSLSYLLQKDSVVTWAAGVGGSMLVWSGVWLAQATVRLAWHHYGVFARRNSHVDIFGFTMLVFSAVALGVEFVTSGVAWLLYFMIGFAYLYARQTEPRGGLDTSMQSAAFAGVSMMVAFGMLWPVDLGMGKLGAMGATYAMCVLVAHDNWLARREKIALWEARRKSGRLPVIGVVHLAIAAVKLFST